MAGYKLINQAAAFEYIDGFVGNAEEQELEALSYAGAFFEQHATRSKNFRDHTSNLKSSIGYAVARDGNMVNTSFGGGLADSPEGKTEGEEAAMEILSGYQTGLVLIALAGMEYGIYVENMQSKSVISQSIEPTKRILTAILDAK
jgi:hypothetical protein